MLNPKEEREGVLALGHGNQKKKGRGALNQGQPHLLGARVLKGKKEAASYVEDFVRFGTL